MIVYLLYSDIAHYQYLIDIFIGFLKKSCLKICTVQKKVVILHRN